MSALRILARTADVPGNVSGRQVRSVHQADAVHDAHGHNEAQVNATDDLLLLCRTQSHVVHTVFEIHVGSIAVDIVDVLDPVLLNVRGEGGADLRGLHGGRGWREVVNVGRGSARCLPRVINKRLQRPFISEPRQEIPRTLGSVAKLQSPDAWKDTEGGFRIRYGFLAGREAASGVVTRLRESWGGQAAADAGRLAAKGVGRTRLPPENGGEGALGPRNHRDQAVELAKLAA